MAKIKVSCQVQTYNTPAVPDVKIHSHWNNRDMVELEVPGCETRIIVSAAGLKAAIDNCTNTAY